MAEQQFTGHRTVTTGSHMDRRAALALGTNMAAGMVLFSWAGHYVDQKLVTEEPWFTLGGMFLGLVYCGYEVWKVVRHSDNDSENGMKDAQ